VRDHPEGADHGTNRQCRAVTGRPLPEKPMLFNSYPFFFLVIGTFSLYYLAPFRNHQVALLIAASLVFYGYSQPYLLILLFLSATINALASYGVYHQAAAYRRRWIAVSGLAFNLLVLAFFKYNKLLDEILPNAGGNTAELLQFLLALPLPVGISFYTFEGISLVMDVYRPAGQYDIKVDRRFARHYRNTLFFIIFFPHLVAGPILKAHDFFPQIRAKYLKDIDFYFVLKTLIAGYFLKSVIADNLKDQTYWIAAPYFETMSSLTLLVMLFGYSMQIFADFAGYSLIAIAVAALFGYQLPQNFNFPYISQSITEFWRRWHISLSSWLKEYLYIGLLGGNRIGPFRTYVNLIVVMFLGGLWHGAALSYGVWGLWHGVGLAVERVFNTDKRRAAAKNPVLVMFHRLWVLTFVSFGWLLFKLTDFNEAVGYLAAIYHNRHLGNSYNLILNIALYSLPVIGYHLLYLVKRSARAEVFEHDYAIYAVMALLILVNGGIPGEFVYFQF
jgi:alginate O-acetyltransferase complex protein AlgI